MLEAIAISSAVFVLYLFIAGRVYIDLRSICSQCGSKSIVYDSWGVKTNSFTKEETRLIIKDGCCMVCGYIEQPRAYSDRAPKWDKDGAAMMAAIWPLWFTPWILLKIGMRNGKRSLFARHKKLKQRQ